MAYKPESNSLPLNLILQDAEEKGITVDYQTKKGEYQPQFGDVITTTEVIRAIADMRI